MKDGLGIFLWKISVALYLVANGVLGLIGTDRLSQVLGRGGDFAIIFGRLGFKGDTLGLFVTIASLIALVAGIALILEMLNISFSFLDTLIFIIAIIWAVYVVVNIVTWVTGGFDNFWFELQKFAVHTMVLASLLIASKRFG